MALLTQYRAGIHETLMDYPDATRSEKFGLVVLTIVGIHSENAFLKRLDGYVAVESKVMLWAETESNEDLEQELKEILNESKPTS